jgi:hypothetical protein
MEMSAVTPSAMIVQMKKKAPLDLRFRRRHPSPSCGGQATQGESRGVRRIASRSQEQAEPAISRTKRFILG